MTEINRDIEHIESHLRQWFSEQAFIKAARIQNYLILPEEQALVANAVSSRQCEFATGRWLARQGLQQFGLPDQPITIGELRNPQWPEAIMGTISHDGDLCAVALMQKQQHSETGIGIDLISLSQREGRLDELVPMFTTSHDELNAVTALNLPIAPAILLFSIKESVVKALSAHLGDFIDMRSIEIYFSNNLQVRLFERSVKAEIYASKSEHYVLTAVKVY